ncbi:hypothetical protein FXN61_18700 [Lentzea sp. PSKA42]|uniref:Uncharacterized protein n=1 Tax=Lentzea indica TaxID=2604800 RepID=A0ABX1FJ08_9PSEU|nr:hypothetical protein [Lentzea indica]NKE58729.1 hypothetical protein [Lentzea indica]
MSEAPTHAAVPTPTSARPQQTEQQTERGERTAQPERTPQTQTQTQTERHAEQHTSQAERTPETERHAERTSQTERTPDAQRTEQRSSSKLEDEWQAVQYEFVDDPKAAVRKADDLVKRAIEELTSRHRSLTEQLKGNGDPQTEDLRLALHRYRELFKSLVAVK